MRGYSRTSGGEPGTPNGTQPIYNCAKCGAQSTQAGPCPCGGTRK